MRKKSLLTMVLALVLVGAIGVGATLAYLSDTTGTLTNTFTVGKVKVTQDESDESTPDKTDRTKTGNIYTNIQPGDTLVKDPTATVLKGSSDCYVFMELNGADELVKKGFSFVGFDRSTWIKVTEENKLDKLDGIYRYVNVVEMKDEDQKLPALFTNVKYDITATELADGVTLGDVTIKTCAVQATNMTITEALAAAQTEMNPQANNTTQTGTGEEQ
ncbi:MAG: SipW-dependent-type signal peptide-containing protein [Lachnospiraceae bacterium]|nr:SipW-dependent-type signal peptide-containing protein [Lachnospiraceae bacterium]